jgi:hypothetical protein
MHHVIRSLMTHRVAVAVAAAAVLGSMLPATLLAQTPAPAAPARETPQPQDIDPAVDTSRAPADSAAPSRSKDLPRPEDVNPGVNTSTTPSASSTTSSAGTTAPAGTAAPKPANNATTANGATPGAAAAGTPQPGGASRTQAKGGGKALDRLELDTTQITGNRELPKVLYIVPWKRSDLGDLVGKPVNSLLDEVLAPVDRDVFKRENRYYRAVMPENGSASGSGATASPSGSASAAPPAKDER